MSYEDKTLTCQDCGQPFTFTADDQSFHAEKGFTNEPKRCYSCRQARRGERNGGYSQGPARNAYSGLRRMWQGCHSSLPAPRRPPGLLQRLLQQTADIRTIKLVTG